MTNLQKLQLRQSELRSASHDFYELEIRSADGLNADQKAKFGALTSEMKDNETKIQTAMRAESEPSTSEGREWSDLEGRFDLGEMFDNVMEHRASTGAIAEVQSERGLGGNALPTELLMEHRAVTPAPADVGQSQSQIEGYVFPRSVADFIGVPSPIVPVGDATFPVLTSDPVPSTPAENDPVTETTGAFSADVLTPKRIQAQFFWSREDAARMAGMGDALREALQGGIADKLDQQIINGTNGLLNGTVLMNHNVSTVTGFSDYISEFGYTRVDGQFAASGADVRLVMGSKTYAHAGGQYRHANADDVALDRLTEITGGVRVSAHVPAVNNDKQNVLIRLGMRRDMVAPVWGAVTLIPDEITKAANGQIVLTAVLLHAVKVLRVGGFHKRQSQHA